MNEWMKRRHCLILEVEVRSFEGLDPILQCFQMDDLNLFLGERQDCCSAVEDRICYCCRCCRCLEKRIPSFERRGNREGA